MHSLAIADPTWHLCAGIGESTGRAQRLWVAIHAAREAFLEYQLQLMDDQQFMVACGAEQENAVGRSQYWVDAALAGDVSRKTWFFQLLGNTGFVFVDPRFGRVFSRDPQWISSRQIDDIDNQIGLHWLLVPLQVLVLCARQACGVCLHHDWLLDAAAWVRDAVVESVVVFVGTPLLFCSPGGALVAFKWEVHLNPLYLCHHMGSLRHV
jgi:hypothetical protein